MFRIIYNKRLLVDTSAEELARVKDLLDRANIKYYVRTVKNTPIILQATHAAYYKTYNMSYSPEKDHVKYVYYLYVKKKDFKRASEIAYGN